MASRWWVEDDRVHVGDHFSVAFQRTLRVPEDDRDYPLPPGFGRLPVLPVAAFADRLPSGWERERAVLVPLYQREALWLGFDGAPWRPNAVVITCGGINAITGRVSGLGLESDPQNYVVTPGQPWLDGFQLRPGVVRQFVATPIGLEQTVSEQLGSADPAALRFRVYEPVPGRFPEAPPRPVREGAPMAGPGAGAGLEMGFAAGGRVTQRIYKDEHGVDAWVGGAAGDLVVYVVNSEQFARVTGRPAPPTPISAADYAAAGLPWFALHDEHREPVAARRWLDRLRTLGQLDPVAAVLAAPGIERAPVVRVTPGYPSRATVEEGGMATDVFGYCIERQIPESMADEARQAERDEQGTGLELALVRAKKWKNGRKLRIRFLDGDPAVRTKVAAVAKEWLKHANVGFDFGDHADADIRISFKQTGYWSAVGTDALVASYFPKDQPTMNFQGFTTKTPDEEYHRVVLHEFGHALGCIHEHQNPANGIKWNKDQVYRDLSGPPNNWNRATIDHNMFHKFAKTSTNFTAFDPKSIMLYAFPKSWTLDGMTFPSNKDLSPTDKTYIAAQYPK